MQTELKNIKYTGLLLAFALICFSPAAQHWRAAISSGYSSNSFDVFGHDYFRIDGGRYNGLDLEYLIDKTFGLQLSYTRQATTLALPCYTEGANTTIERLEFGFTARNWIMQKKLGWITGLGFGACKLFKDPHEQDALKFASSFSAGINYHISKFLGFRLQGRLLQFYSKSIERCVVNNQPETSAYGSVVSQGVISGGLLFSIGR